MPHDRRQGERRKADRRKANRCPQALSDYERGYRNGAADRRLGIRSRYAEAPEHGAYARGYRNGVLGLPK
jgi:hypothetical protein